MEENNASDRWNGLLGCAWTRLLRSQGLSPAGTVVEIGPGFTDKIARGLAALDFRGTVVLVESNELAGAWAFERYRCLLPEAEITLVRRPMPDAKIPFRRSVDALLSNHILDDLILNASLPPEVGTDIFARMQPGAPCSQMFMRRWRELLVHAELLEELTAQVAEDFTSWVAEMQPRLVLLNQYPSWQHNLHGLNSIHMQALRLMQLIETSLGAVCVDATAFHGSSHQSLVRWLIGNRTATPSSVVIKCHRSERVNAIFDYRVG